MRFPVFDLWLGLGGVDQDLAHSGCQVLGIIYTLVQGGRDHF